MRDTNDWDAIVIGAGLAGLSCAAHLAKAGRRVVVIEQTAKPGGLWSSFSRRGFIFDLSTHWVTEPQTLNRMLEDLGGPPVDFIQLEHLGRYVGPVATRGSAGAPGAPPPPRSAAAVPAWDFTVGPDAKAFKDAVRAQFPAAVDASLDKLVEDAIEISRCVDSLPTASPELTPLWSRLRTTISMAVRTRRLRSLSRMPADEYLARLFPGEELSGLRAALHTLAPIAGVPSIGLLAILGTGLRGRLYAPRGGAQVLSDAFAEAARRNGVEIRFCRRATSILAESKRVQGVTLDDGVELRAQAVISAADAKQTFYRLLGRERVPDSYKKLLEAQPVSEPYGLISLVTTIEPASLGLGDTDVFICPSNEMPRALESVEPEDCLFAMIFPRYTEPGADTTERAIQIAARAAYAWREHWETYPTPERGDEYYALKEEWAGKIIARAQEYIPRLSSHLVQTDVATPITFYRYTSNTDGAPVGWHYAGQRRWKQRVPFVRGLYQAGHWVGPSGAVPVTRSGKWAAELVLKDLG